MAKDQASGDVSRPARSDQRLLFQRDRRNPPKPAVDLVCPEHQPLQPAWLAALCRGVPWAAGRLLLSVSPESALEGVRSPRAHSPASQCQVCGRERSDERGHLTGVGAAGSGNTVSSPAARVARRSAGGGRQSQRAHAHCGSGDATAGERLPLAPLGGSGAAPRVGEREDLSRCADGSRADSPRATRRGERILEGIARGAVHRIHLGSGAVSPRASEGRRGVHALHLLRVCPEALVDSDRGHGPWKTGSGDRPDSSGGRPEEVSVWCVLR